MILRTLLVSVLAFGLTAPLLRAEEDRIDVLEVTPEELRGDDTRALEREAWLAYQERRYEDAARAYVRLLRQRPGDANSLYNLACCYGLLGAAGPASAFVGEAWDAGFADLGHIRSDPDFAKVRETDAWKKVLSRLESEDEARRRERGKLLAVTTRVLMPVRIAPPDEPDERRRVPLVIGLHGYGDNAESFATLFRRRDIRQPFLFAVPEAPYPSHTGQRIGFSWHLPTPFVKGDELTGTQIATGAELTREYVLDVLAAVRREHRIDERNVFLMGFSQGAGLAFSLGMRHPGLFRGVIPIGGWLDPGEHAAADVRKAARHGLFLVCHSPEDRMVEWEALETAVGFLNEQGIPHRRLSYPGGHSLPKELMEQVVAWIEKPEADAPGGKGDRQSTSSDR